MSDKRLWNSLVNFIFGALHRRSVRESVAMHSSHLSTRDVSCSSFPLASFLLESLAPEVKGTMV